MEKLYLYWIDVPTVRILTSSPRLNMQRPFLMWFIFNLHTNNYANLMISNEKLQYIRNNYSDFFVYFKYYDRYTVDSMGRWCVAELLERRRCSWRASQGFFITTSYLSCPISVVAFLSLLLGSHHTANIVHWLTLLDNHLGVREGQPVRTITW